MAKDFQRSIRIYIDNSQAVKSAEELRGKIVSLENELKELDAQGKKETETYKNKEKALKNQTDKLTIYEQKVKNTERVLKNLSGATLGELESLQRELKKSLCDVTRGTEEYTAKKNALIAVERQLDIVKKEQNGTLGSNATLWSRAADGFNKYFGLITSAVATITGISFAFRKLSEDAAKMDDTYADVMKTTGMARHHVLDLNEEFKKMDTRTSREELNNLARDAGKLGISAKKDVMDFVELANQINVALGEDLGDGAIRNIGKITEVYKLSTKELDALDLKERMNQ